MSAPHPDRLYRIQQVVRRRTLHGRRQILVRWQGYGAQQDSWIDEDELKRIQDIPANKKREL